MMMIMRQQPPHLCRCHTLLLGWLYLWGGWLTTTTNAVEFIQQDVVGDTGTSTQIHRVAVTPGGNILAAGDRAFVEGYRTGLSSRKWFFGNFLGQWGDIQAIATGVLLGEGLDVVAAQIPPSSSDGALLLLPSPLPNELVTSKVLIPASTQLGSYQVNGIMAHDVKIVDWNKDGKLDILACVTGTVPGQTKPTGWLVLLLQETGGTFSTITPLAEIGGIGRMDVADIDNNGWADVAVLGITTQQLWAVWHNADQTTSTALIDGPQTDELVFAVAVGPLHANAYNTLDIVVVGTLHVFTYIQGNPRTFNKFTLIVILPEHKTFDFRTWQVQLADMNQDGLTDIVMIYGLQNNIMWSQQTAGNIMGYSQPLAVVTEPDSFYLFDLNGDGRLDIATHSADTGYLRALYNSYSTPSPNQMPVIMMPVMPVHQPAQAPKQMPVYRN